MEFRQGVLVDTDYWVADEGRLGGFAWLAVHGETWHLLMPDYPPKGRIKRVVAMPVTARGEEAGWQWAIVSEQKEIDVRVSLCRIVGTAPSLPHPGAWWRRALVVYANHFFHLGPVVHNFGHFTKGEVPISMACDLEVVRPRRTKDGLRFAGVKLPLR